MNIQLLPVTKENWEACIELEVAEKQREFVAPNYYSILQSIYEDNLYPYVIYDEGTLVGFLMYGKDPDTYRFEMCRLMIDKKYQGKGYGKEAIKQLLDIVTRKYGNILFYTSIEPKNSYALNLYQSMGFKKTGEIMWDEEVLVIEL